jgi:Holliday junction resolvasome, DNA-binding subunit
MIRRLRGTVLSVDADSICLDVSGFGLEVFCTGSVLAAARVGDVFSCCAYLQVSDAGMALFGFADETERALFLEIMQVKTMGGKLSIAVLRHLDVSAVVSAILAEDARRLAVPGVGAKRAERICFELRPKVEKKFAGLAAGGAPAVAGKGSVDAGVVSGLLGLGFTQNEAAQAVSACRAEGGEDRTWTEEALLMAALGRLQR